LTKKVCNDRHLKLFIAPLRSPNAHFAKNSKIHCLPCYSRIAVPRNRLPLGDAGGNFSLLKLFTATLLPPKALRKKYFYV
jgi:hypothetical protein